MTNFRDHGRPELIPGERIDPLEYYQSLKKAALSAGFSCQEYGNAGGYPLIYLTRNTDLANLWYVSSGIHGDEPAGPLAILRALEMNEFPHNTGFVIFPLLNPHGLSRGKRENGSKFDLNRDYREATQEETKLHIAMLNRERWRFQGALGLHEDWEARGAYLYEHNPRNHASPCHAMINHLKNICGLEPGPLIDGWEVSDPGIIHPPSDPRKRSYWPEQVYLLDQHTDMSYTVETPSSQILSKRIEAHMGCLRLLAS